VRTGLLIFVARRLAVLPFLLLIISFGVFSLTYIAPGSAEQALLGGRPSTPATLAAIRKEYHLDRPFLSQYGTWVENAVQLDFGQSLRTGQSVRAEIGQSLGATVFLGLYGFAITLAVGVPLGVLAALRKRRFLDRAIVGISVVGVSAPAFASGILLLYVFAVVLGWFPVFGSGTGFTDRLYHLALPAVSLALTAMALVVKLTRTAMIDALEQDYVAFARARGVSYSRVLLAYALRNALVPVVTASGLILGYMLTGAVLVEITFALPGMGSLLVDSANFKDIPTVQGIAVVVAILIVIINLATDILYAVVDPRIRLGGKR
jgi:peptide/nickel transport system permease protein